jgi:hypothetical protein
VFPPIAVASVSASSTPIQDVKKLEYLCQNLTRQHDLAQRSLNHSSTARHALAIVIQHTVCQVCNWLLSI